MEGRKDPKRSKVQPVAGCRLNKRNVFVAWSLFSEHPRDRPCVVYPGVPQGVFAMAKRKAKKAAPVKKAAKKKKR
ncbi:MAG: hypothetical protein DWH80_15965 [Planctomycetota bacterium]|nr:MAG: hypothetical protein DWH80_15965 [Planctomycetota bacterium]